VGEIAAQLGLPLATVSRHVRALHAVGIVESSQRGNQVLYVLSDREVPRLAAAAYRGAAAEARRVIATAPPLPSTDEGGSELTER
jgi:DNA-binding transcriptional ArsR family regulator